MNPKEIAAADYIVSLWGRRRRDFARRYWAFLAYGMPKPDPVDCFGAAHIADRLIDFYQADWWAPPYQDPDHLHDRLRKGM